jgi:hypothetical protein
LNSFLTVQKIMFFMKFDTKKNFFWMILEKVRNTIFFLFLISSVISAGSLETNWEHLSNHSILHMNGNKIFDSRENLKQFPPNLNQDQIIDFSLLVGEYYLLKNDKDSYFNLINLINSSTYDYTFLSELLHYFWRLEKVDANEADSKLEEYVKKETVSYIYTLANAFYQFNKKKGLPKLDFNELKNLTCSRTKPYFSLCRITKLRVGLEAVGYDGVNVSKEYQYIDRSIAPFFEESELAYIPFLDQIIPDLAPKLAYMGFAGEAIHFQKIILQNEKISGKFDITAYERLAFYQMIIDDLDGAEDTLYASLKSLRTLSIIRNGILLKLGAIAYLRKDYEQSLIYFTGINMKYWGRTLRHPILDESISPNGARELIAIVISKAKNPGLAVEALNKLSTTKPDEEELFVRLRIAHIMFKTRPTLTEKITDDIIYTAQGKGWKRLEYAATLLNGYANIVNKKHRKSVIQFTKSYGILGNIDPNYSSEWMRLSGMLTARVQGKERGNHGASYSKLISVAKKENISSDELSIRMYLDSRFALDEFIKQGINYFIANREYESLLSALYYNQLLSPSIIYKSSLLQINGVHARIKQYRGFRPPLDNIYYKGYQTKVREEEAQKIDSESEEFNIGFVKKINDPFIAIFPAGDVINAIAFQPDKNRWTYSVFSSQEYKTSQYFLRIINTFPFIDKGSVYQIYLNRAGLDLYQFLKKNNFATNARLFYNFQPSNKKDTKDLEIVAPDCLGAGEKKIPGFNYYTYDYYEGSKAFESNNRLQVWKFPETTNKGDSVKLETYNWKCDSRNYLSFQKLERRIEKSIPNAILFTNPVLQESNTYTLGNDFLSWSDFWMRKGTSSIYFLDRIENDPATIESLSVFSKPNPEVSEFIHLQEYLSTNSRDSVILLREPR